MADTTKGPLVIDIETAGRFQELPEEVQDYLVEREARREPKDKDTDTRTAAQRTADGLALNPAAGTIVCIGLHTVVDHRSLVLVNAENGDKSVKKEPRYDDAWVFYGSEQDILAKFWQVVGEKAGPGGRGAKHPLVTFNGRAFDGPFLMLRSVVHGVKPTRNMVGYRFGLNDHCDLFEVLSFMGALSSQSRFSLDFWCRMLGVESPKSDMDGSQVGVVWESGDYDRLIQYSVADVRATAHLYAQLLPLIESMS